VCAAGLALLQQGQCALFASHCHIPIASPITYQLACPCCCAVAVHSDPTDAACEERWRQHVCAQPRSRAARCSCAVAASATTHAALRCRGTRRPSMPALHALQPGGTSQLALASRTHFLGRFASSRTAAGCSSHDDATPASLLANGRVHSALPAGFLACWSVANFALVCLAQLARHDAHGSCDSAQWLNSCTGATLAQLPLGVHIAAPRHSVGSHAMRCCWLGELAAGCCGVRLSYQRTAH
jgi:hypothetical protein